MDETIFGDNAEDPATIRPPLGVLVVARQPIARAGLRGLLGELGDVLVVGVATTVEHASGLAPDVAPDVVLMGWQTGDLVEVAGLAETLGANGVPLVLLGSPPSPDEFAILLRAGARGFLLSDATADDVGAAIAAVARGLLVLDPLLVRALPATNPTTLSVQTSPGEPSTERELLQLTEREREVLQLLALGLPNKTIAKRLNITEHTVKFHVGSILAKLDAGSRTEAVMHAARQGMLTL
jgi:DNA-binding NarL/FixJ family response regulator